MSTREALAASVEELTTREKPEIDELEEEDENAESLSGAALIPPRLHLQSRPLPVVRVEGTRHRTALEERWGHTVELASAPGRRPTKIRLQAVRSGLAQEPVTENVPITDMNVPEQREFAQDEQPLVRRLASPGSAPSSLLCGSGMIEEGQEDVTIQNQRVSAQSVVTVMLAGNPGPVVVHYVSVQPRAGFTLHMSAPVSAPTPFTYAVWLF
ncbi:MAG TPA: hypothetical protein VF458_15230 [Ktedonobacteraceae bacterium]